MSALGRDVYVIGVGMHPFTNQPPSVTDMAYEAGIAALEDAGIGPEAIVHLNAHATSTPAGDIAEASAICAALGDHVKHVAVSATKSMTGHLLGGAGAVESIFCVLALYHRLAPPTINIVDFDEAITLDVVRDVPRALPSGPLAALNNSFGFGGHNVALVIQTYDNG